MADGQETTKNNSAKSAKMRSEQKQRNHLNKRGRENEVRPVAQQDTSRIVAKAYEEAAKIIDEAKRKAEHIISEADEGGSVAYSEVVPKIRTGC